LTLWCTGYPKTGLADADKAISLAHEIAHASTLMNALYFVILVRIFCGDYAAANAEANELVTLADKKDSLTWKASGRLEQGCILAVTGKPADAVQIITSQSSTLRSAGQTVLIPLGLLFLARSHADLGQSNDAWRCIGEAITRIEASNERWNEAEVIRIAGEIALKSPEPDAAKAQAYFERALAVARKQQAKSWELRAAMSMARLWRDQGKPQQARELLAPVYGWFTEGFDTLDLKEAKALLDELAS
jgi:predicted ATPase